MKFSMFRFSIGVLLSVHGSVLYSQDTQASTALYDRLQAIQGVVKVAAANNNADLFRESYVLRFSQPVNHAEPNGPSFLQRVFVSHVDCHKPVLLETEGYASWGNRGGGELLHILGANRITVEHRYFGQSVPEPRDWQYLTVKQSADDLHCIVKRLKSLYPGKWISSGRSKGGQTALFYKCHYPEDVDAVVAYVAPVNLSQEDPRMTQFPFVAGDAKTRKMIQDYQRILLQREDEILPLIRAEAEQKRWTFGMGLATAYEYGVLEYPYSFWQDGGIDPNQIPSPDAPIETLTSHYQKAGVLWYYSDQGKKMFEPFLYQAYTEIGYYNYDITPFKPYLKALERPSNRILCPEDASIAFHPATMYFVHHFLQYKADRVIYIYGEKDAWSASQIQLLGHTDAFKYVVSDAHHGAGIRRFSPEQKASFYANMERWLKMPLNRL